MKKILKICFISILLLLIIAAVAEISIYITDSKRLISEGYTFENNKKFPTYHINIKTFRTYFENRKQVENFQSVAGENYKNPAIVLFGDVYAKELAVEPENSFAQKLADITKRPIYNWARPGWGIAQMYYLLKNEDSLNKISDVDTVIFVYNPDMLTRLYSYSYYPHHKYLNLKYTLDNGKLVESNPKHLWAYNSYIVRNWERKKGWENYYSNTDTDYNYKVKLIKRYFLDSRKEAKNRFPKLKNFIILRYVLKDDNIGFGQDHAYTTLGVWGDLKAVGFKIVDVTELTNVDLRCEEFRNADSSPSPKAYDIIIPPFTQRTGLLPAKDVKVSKVVNNKKSVKKVVSKPVVKTKQTVSTETETQIEPIVNQIEIQEEKCDKNLTKKNFFNRLKKNKKESN